MNLPIEGTTLRLRYVAEMRDGSGVVNSGTDVHLKVHDVTADAWWTGAAWGVETELNGTHFAAGAWYYDLALADGLAGHEIEWVWYDEVDGTVVEYGACEVLGADTLVAAETGAQMDLVDAPNATAVAAVQDGLALEATLDELKGAGWTNETLAAIHALVEALNDLSSADAQAAAAAALAAYDAATGTDVTNATSGLSTFDAATDEVNVGEVKGVAVTGVDDFKATGFSTHTAADAATAVWAAGTRTLTGFGTLVADIVAGVWGAAQRTLTAFGFITEANVTQVGGAAVASADDLKADVSSLATSADIDALNDLSTVEVQGIIDALQTHGDSTWTTADVSALALEATLAAIKGAGWTNETLVAIKAVLDAAAADVAGLDGAGLAEIAQAVVGGLGSWYPVSIRCLAPDQSPVAGVSLIVWNAAADAQASVALLTNADGEAPTIGLPPGSYQVLSASNPWYDVASTPFVVEDEAQDVTVMVTRWVPASPPSAEYCTVYGYARSVGGAPGAGTVVVTRLPAPATQGEGPDTVTIFRAETDRAPIDAQGRWQLPLLRGAVVDIEERLSNSPARPRKRAGVLVPDAATANWETLQPPSEQG